MTSTRYRSPVATVASLVVVAAALSPAAASEDPASTGRWLPWFSENPALNFPAPPPQDDETVSRIPTAASIAVLPDGNVVYWNGFQDTEGAAAPVPLAVPPDQTSKSRILDLSRYFATGSTAAVSWRTPTPDDGGGGDMFCSDQRVLPDGRVLVVGGTSWVNEDDTLTSGTPAQGFGRTDLYGLKSARLFDAHADGDGGTWTQGASMRWGRWYPTLLTLSDGKMLVAGGVERLFYNSSLVPGDAPPEHPLPQNVRESETYDPAADTWTPNGDSVSLPLYPRLHLLPNGKVLYDSTGQPWAPFGEDRDQLGWGTLKWYDPSTRTWWAPPVSGTSAHVGHRGAVFSVMLPLQPPYDRARVLIGGGTLGPSPSSAVTTPMSEIVSIGPEGVRRDLGPLMNAPRWFSSGVALPTGEVVALNGADRDHAGTLGLERGVRLAEIFDGERWVPLAASGRDRTYHNSAVLLRDGSILVGGHSPISGNDPSTAPGHTNNFKDPTFEIFKPPYLFRGTRPAITSGVPEAASYGETLDVSFSTDTAPATGSNATVVLSRLPSTTHVTDADQRTVALPTLALTDGEAGGTIRVDIPDNRNALPPGYYYAFVVRTNTGHEKATVSAAEIVRIG